MGEMIPIVMFLVFGLVIIGYFYFRHRTRQEIQTTVRSAMEHGQQLTPEVLEGLSDSLNSRHGDLRRGVISIALGIAFFLFAAFLDNEDLSGPLRAISAFPFLIGIAYMALWFFIKRKAD